MRRIGRLLNCGCIAGILMLAGSHGALALAQDAQTKLAPPPAPPVRVQADEPPEKSVNLPGAIIGGAPELQEVLEEQRKEYRALMISELYFCRVACDLTDEQIQRIEKRAGLMIEEAAARAARLELAPARRGGIRLNTDPVPPNAVKVVREGVLKLVKENTTAAQQSRYQAELGKRAASWRQTAIHALIAKLDRRMCFTTLQRDRLLQVFESNWDDEWGATTFESLAEESVSFPAIPNRLIVPLLSATQQKVWKEFDIQAVDATDFYINYVSGLMEGVPPEFTEGLDAGARGALKAAEAKPDARLKKDASNKGSH